VVAMLSSGPLLKINGALMPVAENGSELDNNTVLY
jgi:hypothetical protein